MFSYKKTLRTFKRLDFKLNGVAFLNSLTFFVV